MRRGGGKLRQRQGERLLAAGPGAVGLLRQLLPLAVLKSQDANPLARMHSAAKCEEMFAALRVAPTKLDPRIAEPVLVLIHEQIALHALGWVRIRFDTMRGHFAIEQKRKLQSQDPRLSGAIVSPQKQASVFKQEFFLIKFENVQYPAAQRLTALAGRPRQRTSGHFIYWSVDEKLVAHSQRFRWFIDERAFLAGEVGDVLPLLPAAAPPARGTG